MQDCNDNPPEFANPSLTASVREDAQPGTFFFTLSASDSDAGRNAEVNYTFVIGSEALPFAIQPRTGAVYVNHELDREMMPAYTVTVVAQNTVAPYQSSTATIHIKVGDVNDNGPVFAHTVYRFVTDEWDDFRNTPSVPILLGNVSAVDRDSGNNGAVRYKIAYTFSKLNDDSVTINAITGEITLHEHLDRETKSRYTLRVMAVDQGAVPHTSTCTVRITVRDTNDNAPEFVNPQPGKQAVVLIREDEPVGSFVYKVVAYDRDEGQNGRIMYRWAYSLSKADFQLNNRTGEIRTRRRLDFEKQNFYPLTVVAMDRNPIPMKKEATVTVRILDVNDMPPRFVNTSDLHLNIPKVNLKPDSFVAHLLATDPEPTISGNGKVEYAITGGSAKRSFRIDETNGNIFVSESEAEVNSLVNGSSYTLQVTAMDRPAEASNSLSAVYLLHIHIVLELLYFPIRSQTVQLSERTEVGHPIVRVQAADR